MKKLIAVVITLFAMNVNAATEEEHLNDLTEDTSREWVVEYTGDRYDTESEAMDAADESSEAMSISGEQW